MPDDSRAEVPAPRHHPPAWVRLIERIATALAMASGLAIILLMVLTTVDVTLRKASGSGIPGTIEITEIVLVAVVFLAIMAAELGDVHVRTPILVERLRGRTATIARLIGLVIAFSYSVFAAWLTLGQAISSTQRGEFRFGVAFVPVWPAKLLIPLGFAGLALALLVKIAAKIVELNPHARPLVLSDASSIAGVAHSEADLIAQAVTSRDDEFEAGNDTRRRDEEGHAVTLEILLLIVFGAFVALVLLEVPIALAIGISGFLGIVLLNGSIAAAQVLASMPFSGTAKYGLFVIPMYILLGTLIANAGIGAGIYRAANRFVGRLPGGLAATAVVATSLFSGISGSSAADVATFGRISVNEMTKFGYSRAYAAAVVAAAGAFAALIPPSIALVLYAIIAEVSVGAMIIAGVIPGILSAVVLCAFVIVNAALSRPGTFAEAAAVAATSSTAAQSGQISDRQGSSRILEAPTTTAGDGGPTRDSRDQMLDALREGLLAGKESGTGRRDAMAVLYAAIIFVIVIGGLYAGIFTATESGAIGAFAALVIALVARKSREMPLRQLIVQSLKETASVTSMIFLLLIGGAIFAFFIASSGAPRMVTQWATSLPVDPLVVVALLLLVLLVLGMFLDGLTILLLTVPLIAPIVTGLGFDGIWFGILVLKVIEIGLITPPVGINCFIISGIAKVPVAQVFVQLVPFVLLDLALTAVLLFFPEVILFLPRAAGLL